MDELGKQEGLVTWPTDRIGRPGTEWVDIGEGGLYAWLIAPWTDHAPVCYVGEKPKLSLTGCVNDLNTMQRFWASHVPLLGSYYLGSTDCSLWNTVDEQYFTVSVHDLRPKAITIWDNWQTRFKSEAYILTFLEEK